MKVRKAVIPAAGLGTRMLPASKSVPKEMLPMVDKPVLQYIVEEAVAAGIEDILIITNRGKGAMDDYFDYAPELERRLEASGKMAELAAVRRPAELANLYFIRQKETKGLGHAIGQARRFVGDEPFAILLGDDIMRAERPVIGQLIEAAEAYDASVIGVQQVPDEMVSKYGVIKAQPLGKKFETAELDLSAVTRACVLLDLRLKNETERIFVFCYLYNAVRMIAGYVTDHIRMVDGKTYIRLGKTRQVVCAEQFYYEREEVLLESQNGIER